MATIFQFPNISRVAPVDSRVSVDIEVLLRAPSAVLDKHFYRVMQRHPGALPVVLSVVRIAADALAPGEELPPGWDAENAQARRAELLSLLALYPDSQGESRGQPTR